MQVLVYPVTDCDLSTPSYRENRDGYLLTENEMRWFFDCYTRGGIDPADWRISPLRARDVAGVAPALILTAEYDPLRDDGEMYGKRLKEAGVQVTVSRYDGMIHDFPDLFEEPGKQALTEIASALQAAFHSPACPLIEPSTEF